MKNLQFTNRRLNSSRGGANSPPGARLRQEMEMEMKMESEEDMHTTYDVLYNLSFFGLSQICPLYFRISKEVISETLINNFSRFNYIAAFGDIKCHLGILLNE